MRKKKNILDMASWRMHIPNKCCYCGEEAVGTLIGQTFTARAERDLCRECYQKWLKGDLYL